MKRLITLLLVVLIAFGACTAAVGAAQTDDGPAETGTVENYPILRSADATRTGLRVSWYSWENAAQYRVFYKTADASKWRFLGDTDRLYYDHTNAPMYTKYIYTVRALDKSGRYISGYNKNGCSGIRYREPSVTKLENIENGVRVTVADAATTAEERMGMGFNLYGDVYKIFVKGGTFGNSWKLAATSGKNTVNIRVDRDNSGQKLSFTVRKASSYGGCRSYFNAGKAITHIAAPEFRISTVRNGQQISVYQVKGAAKFRVFVRGEDTRWKIVGDTTCSIVNKNVSYGRPYNYTVRAMNAAGRYISGYLSGGHSLDCLETPVLTKLTAERRCLKLTWSAVPGAYRYKVFRKDDIDNTWETMASVAGTSFEDYYLFDGSKFTYTVRCVDEQGSYTSYYDTKGLSRYYYGLPEIYASDNTADGIKLIWDTCSDVSKYRVFVRSGERWKAVADVADDTYTFTDAGDGASYEFTVRGLNKNGAYCTLYADPGYFVTYYADAPTTYDDERLVSAFKEAVRRNGIYDEGEETHLVIPIVDLDCYGENAGDITDNLIRLGEENIDYMITLLRQEMGEYYVNGFDTSGLTFHIEKEENEEEGARGYYLCLGLENIIVPN